MSPITKILIVLLTISTIALCPMVVTYVATADNFREKNKTLNTRLRAETEKSKSAARQLKEEKEEFQRLEDQLNNKIASLETKITALAADLKNAEREKAALLQQVNNWTSITKDFYETNDKQGQLLRNTLDRLKEVQAEQIKQKKNLKETSAALVEKMAIIETLGAEKKRLVEEKSELQSRMDRYLQPRGKVAAVPTPITTEIDTARPAIPPGRDINLKALITAVDLKNSMAGISIGTADGVKEGMTFHVTRGDQFICNIVILDTDTEEAVGVLDLVQQPPKVGDSAATNL